MHRSVHLALVCVLRMICAAGWPGVADAGQPGQDSPAGAANRSEPLPQRPSLPEKGQAPATKEKQDARLRLLTAAHQHYVDGDVESAFSLTSAALQLDRELFGVDDDRVAWRLRDLANYALEMERPAKALRLARAAADLVRSTHAPAGWQVEDTQRFVQVVDAVATLPRSQRQQFLHSARLVMLAEEQNDLQAALKATQYRARVLGDLLGERHLSVVIELLSIQDLLIQMHDTATAQHQLHRLARLIPQISRVPNTTYARLYSTWALWAEEERDNGAAEQHYLRAIELFAQSGLRFEVNYPIAHNNYATLLEELGRFAEALRHYKIASQLWANELDRSCWIYRTLQDNLLRLEQNAGDVARDASRWTEAEHHFRDAEKVAAATWGEHDYRALEMRAEIEQTARLRSMTPAALEEFAHSLELAEQSAAAEEAGDTGQALALAQAKSEIVARLCGETAIDTLRARHDVARLLPAGKEKQQAFAQLSLSFEKTLGKQHPEYGALLLDMAYLSDASETVALQRAKQAVAIYAASAGESSWDYANVLSQYGRLLYEAEDPAAEHVLLEARTRWQNLGETDSSDYVSLISDLGSYYRESLDRPMTALPLATEAVEIARQILGYGDAELSTLINELANVYYTIQKYDRALELYLEAIGLARKSSALYACDLNIMLRNVGELYYEKEDYAATQKYFREILDGCTADSMPCGDLCLEMAISLAATYRNLERYDDAAQVLDKLDKLLDQHEDVLPEAVSEYLIRLELQRLAITRDQKRQDAGRASLTKLWRQLQANLGNTKTPAATAPPLGPEPNLIPATTWGGLLIELYEMADDFEDAALGISIREAYAGWAERIYEDQPWVVAEARCDLNEARQRAACSDDERQQLEQADQLWSQAAEVDLADFLAEGMPLMRRAVEIQTRVLGEFHRTVATSLMELAWRELNHGKSEQAYKRYLQSVKIRQALLGDGHLQTANLKAYAAIAARRTSRFDESERLLLESLAAQEKILGADHLDLAETYHRLAILYNSSGRFASALPAALDASERFAVRDGEMSYNYANALRTLYAAYDAVGETAKGSEVLIKSHHIFKQLYEPTDVEFLDSLHAGADLASQYTATFQLSGRLFDQLLAGLKAANLSRTARYADALNGYGNLYHRRGEFSKALEAYQQTLALRQEIYDQPDHPLIAQAHSQIGSASLRGGDLATAQVHLETAYRLRRQRLGDNSHEIVYGLYQLARVNALQRNTATALEQLTKCFEIEQRSLDENFLLGSESAIADELDSNDDKFALLLSLDVSGESNLDRVESALSWTLGRKGLALDMACRLQTAQRSLAHRPETVKALTEIQALKDSLAENVIATAEGQDEADRQAQLKRISQLERQLSLQIRDAQLKTTKTRVDVSELRRRIPADSALVEFVVTPLADLDNPRGEWTPEHVLAFYVPAEHGGPCRLLDLGPAAEIDALIEKMRKHVERLPRSIRLTSEAELERQFQTISQALCQRLLGALESDLADLQHLIVAPDGNLHGIPFAALSRQDGRYLIEDLTLSYVSSGRELLRDQAPPGSGSLILADPDYDASSGQRAAIAATLRQPGARPDPWQLALRSADIGELRSLRWRQLPGARQEAEEVQLLLDTPTYAPVQSYLGAQAVEEVLKATISPRLVHIATHGFYLPYQAAAATQSLQTGGASGTGLGQLRRDANPLMRSGIVLAGANQLARHHDATAQVDDGWVTAQEIASIDFRNTELVVLSACESGLGEAQLGHGVHGLRRALLIAGAHNLLTSLFEVPDAETRELMGGFYKSLAKDRQPAAALQDAQRTMINKRRTEHHAAHPFYWASFFVLGKPQS